MSHDTAAADGSFTIRVAMPGQLRALAGIDGEVEVLVAPPVTVGAALDALESDLPTLRGAIRDRDTRRRRAMIRVYADGEDLSDAAPTQRLPEAVLTGREPLRLVGAIAGG